MKLIKTLPHLSDLFIDSTKLTIWSSNLSYKIYNAIKEALEISLDNIQMYDLESYLTNTGYQLVSEVTNNGEYSKKGDTLTVWGIGYLYPVRLEFFGDSIEKGFLIDNFTRQKLENIKKFILIPAKKMDLAEAGSLNVKNPEKLDLEKIIFSRSANLEKFYTFEEVIETDFTLPPMLYSRSDLLEQQIKRLEEKKYNIIIKTKHKDALDAKYLNYIGKEASGDFLNVFLSNLNKTSYLDAGLESNFLKLAVLTDREILGSVSIVSENFNKINTLEEFNIKRLLSEMQSQIEVGDFVVHLDYGVGIYNGIVLENINSISKEFLEIKFDREDKLLLPVEQSQKISKYIGLEGSIPKLGKLGGKAIWKEKLEKIQKATKLIAHNLIKHYAALEVSEAAAINLNKSHLYLEFESEFKYKETGDQLRAIEEICLDLSKTKPMNRLLVGDVGFGKTEVFLRAAFKVIEQGMQVAILAPTTILTAQHYAVISERFKNFPVKVAYLSRFNTPKQNSQIINEINLGKIDLVIGTHRLLSSDVKFKNLGFIVIDEEQRFGVRQKEKIKQLNYGAHLLSVSATPIPRTLGMALSSIQSISIITQPPNNRISIKTEISGRDLNKIAAYIEKEIQRGGQAYIIHNEISTIDAFKAQLEKIMPGVKFIAAHAQMRPALLDKIMTDFYQKRFDVLVSTTIVENGIDLPNVNTIIIDNANKFGLSQLYQLRGRVGRSTVQAYCLLINNFSLNKDELEDATIKLSKLKKRRDASTERIEALVENQDLGAGFRISSRDLEIRGAGNLLGEEQSGHIFSVGFSLYMEMLAEEIVKQKNNSSISKPVL